MKFAIINRWSGSVLFAAEVGTLRLAVELAVQLGADLRGADLRRAALRRAALWGANLWGANLGDANLEGANLARADLARADLARAYLPGANLARAYLTGANLAGANLARADLTGADLTGANLTDANLMHAYFTDANLTRTVLDPTIRPEGALEADGWKRSGDHVRGWRSRRSTHVDDTEYVAGRRYVAPVFSVCGQTVCHPGIYLWPTRALAEAWTRKYGTDTVELSVLAADVQGAGLGAERKWRARAIEVVEAD